MSIVSPMPSPRRRAASCWSVEVVNAGGGARRSVSRATDATSSRARAMRAAASRAARSEARPASSTSAPSRRRSAAANGAPPGADTVASTRHEALGTKASISASRSHTRRSATDCTLPAERHPGSLRHSTGESP